MSENVYQINHPNSTCENCEYYVSEKKYFVLEISSRDKFSFYFALQKKMAAEAIANYEKLKNEKQMLNEGCPENVI